MRILKLLSALKTWDHAKPVKIPIDLPAADHLDVVLLDSSRSMSESDYPPTRWDGAVAAFETFIEAKQAKESKDLVGVARFSFDGQTLLSPKPAEQFNDDDVNYLYGLIPFGNTNHYGGLQTAWELITTFQPVISSRIIMLTDGWTTAGPGPAAFAEVLKQRSVQIDVVGVGGQPSDVNEAQLKFKIASKIDGEIRYWFIRSVEDLTKKFEALAVRPT